MNVQHVALRLLGVTTNNSIIVYDGVFRCACSREGFPRMTWRASTRPFYGKRDRTPDSINSSFLYHETLEAVVKGLVLVVVNGGIPANEKR